ncbi:late embryogenesis abundant protein [Striga asiatica]|uniref:Late embryogenesis abundant protein n=1 Tax=Striga asiatica TaxID=4170 RepID=A0A5A7P4C5_STRAF|nr:late embryogenesis abundant protein [Striga asiatica]
MGSSSSEDEEEALFPNYPYALYFVKSPSTASHADVYSSKSWSDSGGGWWFRYFTFGYFDSGCWVLLQLGWRFLLSLAIALIVFYIAANPPPPNISLQIVGFRQFRLGEGVDGSGVTTKLLSCNCSIDLIVDNNSKLFALHIHPPLMEISFGHLPFAMSQSKELYAGSNDITLFRLNVGTRNKPLYGAGRNMQDLLQSGEGLPLVVRVGFTSSFHVVWGLIVSKFHHEAQCLVVLSNKYDKKHKTQVYNSTCMVYS